MQIIGHELHHMQDPDRYSGLEKAGFKAGLHGDLWTILCGRQGGHYVDVGTSEKIADGLASFLLGPPLPSILFLTIGADKGKEWISCRDD